jgi:hypothetical protein
VGLTTVASHFKYYQSSRGVAARSRMKETDVISFKYFREIRDVVKVFFATYMCCAWSPRAVMSVPFPSVHVFRA